MGDARGVRHATLALVLVLAACGDAASTDVTGPYTGAHHRFVVDAVSLPRDVGAAMAIGADLDGDGTVGAPDLAILLGAWGPTGANPADFNGDGEVGAWDIAWLLGKWGACGG